jgi:DNA-binding transcriptional MerR regulator/methanogenic corrinoid protein MtbC1
LNGRDLYKMRTVSRITGFSPALLRAWETRHGILAPRRAPRGHRLYTDDDLGVLRRVRELLDQGRSIGEIAIAGRKALLHDAGAAPAPWPPGRGETGTPAEAPGPLAQLRDAVVRASVAIDAPAVERTLDAAFALVAPELAIDAVVAPAATAIGELWAAGECSVAGEHLASSIYTHRLRRLVDSAGTAASGPAAIAACWPEEQHEAGALVAAFHLGKLAQRVTYLGPSLPFADLGRAIEALAPRATCLSVSRHELLLAHRRAFLELVASHPGTAFVVGGQAVSAGDAELEAAGVHVLAGNGASGVRAELARILGRGATRPAKKPRA